MTKKQKVVLYRIILTVILLVAMVAADKVLGVENGYIRFGMYMIPYLVIGYDILKKAVLGIIHGEVFDENFLMAIATIGAMGLGEYLEGAAVMLFYQIGELFQSYAVGKSRKNIAALMDIRPDYANIEEDGQLVQVDPDEIAIGTIIVVQPGEKVAIDGVVVEGNATLNTSALTGESIPVEVAPGDSVISGSINMSGVLRIRTEKEFDESTVSKILELVENSAMKKAKTENFISKFARYYTPFVCYMALALAIGMPVIQLLINGTPEWKLWFIRALTILVISCPCALVISIPLSFFGGIGAASARGILVKGSNYMEVLADTNYVVCDKTGTLTEGVFRVNQINAAGEFNEETLLEVAALAEGFSNHPISKSLKEAYKGEIDLTRVTDLEEISGHGVIARVDGREVVAGNEKLMKKQNISYELPKAVGTIVYVAVDGEYAGHILIADVVKKNARQAVKRMKASGVKEVIMLTGDAQAIAESVAKEVGVDKVYSELLPAQKVERLEEILSGKQPKEMVAFVGDGINDAPVLSRADLGIAMGALGSDAAIEAADIVLMDDNPDKIITAIRIARKTLGIVRQNITFSLIVKFGCLFLGAIGLANMWMAIFADVGVMILAVLNAMRALRIR